MSFKKYWIVSSKTLGEVVLEDEKEAKDLFYEENDNPNSDAKFIPVIEHSALQELKDMLEDLADGLEADQQEPQHPGRKHFENKEAWQMYRDHSANIAVKVREALALIK